MASADEVANLPNELCPECGSRFARDLKGRGYRRHLQRRPKRDQAGNIKLDIHGDPEICGGTAHSWGKGNRS